MMGIARSTHYDRPEKPADDTAIVEAIFAICDPFEFYGYRRVGAALRQQAKLICLIALPPLDCARRRFELLY